MTTEIFSRTATLGAVVQEALELSPDRQPGENPEYMRGMCELIARCFPVMYMHTDERADEIEALIDARRRALTP